MVDNYKVVGGHKYMWDGETYNDEGKATEVADEYSGKGFEIKRFEEEGKYLVYTRREAVAEPD